jgi:5-methylcytosine-specific restriction endonuclease McrA
MSNRNGPGATTTDLSELAVRMLTGGGPSGNSRQQGSGWFGPWQPLRPVAPPQVKGREWDFRVGYNLATRTRAYEGLPFHALKNFAKYDVVALAIETRKDQMSRLPWSIAARKNASGAAIADVSDADIETITNFFRRPDGRHAWATWLRMLCHEQMETDTAAIYPHRDRGPNFDGGAGAELLALELIDGTTMKPVIDDFGRIAEGPGVAAYQQILHGLPAVDYESTDLLYMPRNPRVGKVYGFSPVEQIFRTIEIAIKRQEFQRDYFTSGNMPEGLVGLPVEWTPDQCAAFIRNWDEMLAGNASARAGRIKFVPGDVGKTYVAFKDPELSGKFDEYLIRHVCYAFSLPPTPFVAQVNRATASSAHDAALEEGLAPMQAWAKEWLDFIISTYWPRIPVEFMWEDDREIDALVQETVITGYVKTGVYSINEGRDILGKAPDPDGDKLRVLTANGFVLLSGNDDAPTAGEAAQSKSDQATENAKALAEGGQNAAAPGSAGGRVAPGAGGTSTVSAKPADDKGAPAAKLGKADEDERDAIELRDWPEDLRKKNVHGSKWIRPEKRAAIYLRDSSKCVYCGSHDRLSLDHVIPRDLGGTHQETNLVTACVSCNSKRQDTPLKKWIVQLHNQGADVKGLGARITKLTKAKLDIAAGKQAIADKKVSVAAPAIEASEPTPLPSEGEHATAEKPSEPTSAAGDQPRDEEGRFASKAEVVAADPPATFRPSLAKQRQLAKTYWGSPRRHVPPDAGGGQG